MNSTKTITKATHLTARSGFGTCQKCWVHACPRHGDRLGNYDFRCVDHIATDAVTVGVATAAPNRRVPAEGSGGSGSADVQAFVHSLYLDGDRALLASAPGIAAPAVRLTQPQGLFERMSRACDLLARNVSDGDTEDWLTVAHRQHSFELDGEVERARAVGFFVDDRPPGERREEGRDPAEGEGLFWLTPQELIEFRGPLSQGPLIAIRIRQLYEEAVAAFSLQMASEFQGEQVRRHPDPVRALPLLALAAVYAARGSDSLDDSPWRLPGVLRLPGPVFFLAVYFHELAIS